MSHPLQALRDMIRGSSSPTSGTVVSVNGGSAKVRTRIGIAAYPTNGKTVVPGQRVALNASGVVSVFAHGDNTEIIDL